MGSVRAPKSHKNKTQYLTLTTNLIPSGVHMFTLIRKVCVLRENTTEQDPGPGVESSYFPRSPKSHEVLSPAKS